MSRQPDSLAPILTGGRQRLQIGLALLWAVACLTFWVWWLEPAHVVGTGRFVLVSGLLGWVQVLGLWYVAFTLRAVRSIAPDPVSGRWRVAMITTKTPSEPWSVVRRTLNAMLAQDHPHDTWLADEDPSAETLAWCAAHGVRVSCRKGVAEYHRATWPRRTRCKEGNLAYFYDHWGYRDYDIVSQLDSDHMPQPGYLREVLRPFADPAVGYVSAPSICAANAPENWAARTRLYAEGPFHGILQAGYTNGLAPMCIGSHYAVRTVALSEVGGLGPELAEDHSTTLLLNAGGWTGVHAIDAIAIGDGPATVGDMVTQEFQWSRSLVTLLLQYTPRYLGRLPWRLRAQFLFCQLLYPIFAITMAVMYLLPVSAVVLDIRYVDVTWPAYVLHAAPPALLLLAISWVQKSSGLFRPVDAQILGWEKVLFVLLQWPWVAWGCLMAVRDWLSGRFVDFRITPKGEAARGRLPTRVLLVYAALALGCLLPVLAVERLDVAKGFYALILVTGLLYTATVVVIVLRHLSENDWAFVGRVKDAAVQFGILATLALLAGFTTSARLAEGVYGLSIGAGRINPVEARFQVAGAGGGMAGRLSYEWAIPWN
ncbi:glycosyltransferase family 2 protein [Rubellimicrobium rubrum]|nr:glycosyltransferase family 2 protein [Rubellimicrobium rubrum]